MNRPKLAPSRVPLLLAVLLAGCTGSGTLGGNGGTPGDDDDSTDGSARDLDASAVGDADILRPYSAGLQVAGWGGESTWTVESGELPPGLALGATGVISGSPQWLGTFTFTVRATGLPFADTVGDVTMSVVPGPTPVGLGYDRDQLNNMSEEDRMVDAWLRISGAGITELGSHTITPGIYASGGNGLLEGGLNDDVLVGEVDPNDVTVTAGTWSPAPGQPISGSPITNDGLTFTAGEDTGELAFTLSHPDWEDATFRVMAVPPDWCPKGKHEGGAWAPGQCE